MADELGHRDEAEITVPEADYIITIDADSIILPDYVLKLVSIMKMLIQPVLKTTEDSRSRKKMKSLSSGYITFYLLI